MKITGIVIPHDAEEPTTKLEFDQGDLSKMQQTVGGNVEVLDIEEVKASLWFNEEGKLMQLPINYRATFLLWVYRIEFAQVGDFIAGTTLITGMPDDEGDTTSVSEDVIKLLFETKEYRVVFNFAGDTAQQSMNTTFTDWPTAFELAFNMGNHERHIENVRVIPAP